MSDRRLTENFFLSEFLVSDTAVRKGLDNTPNAQQLANIVNVLAPNMQRVRNVLGSAVILSSGFRSEAVNRAVGGSRTSQHREGLAADFTCPGFGTPRFVAKYLMGCKDIPFDQLIWEGSWVHISFVPRAPRGQVLTAHFQGKTVTYSTGIA